MGKQIIYITLFFIIPSALISCRNKNSIPDLRETYAYKDMRPFGAFAAYNLLNESYAPAKIEISKEAFGNTYSWNYDTASLYVNISSNFYTTERDADALLDFVYKGNTAFIASANIDSIFLAKIFCKQSTNEMFTFLRPLPFKKTSVSFIDVITPAKDSFSYFFLPFNAYFPEINGSYARIAGYNEEGKTNFFVFFWGKGRLYLHADPRAFSNYFLLTKNNYRYMQHILEILPATPENVYWDNFYNKKNYPGDDAGDKDFSTLGTIMKHRGLANAFWIALVLLLLYILFNSKRRQRIIPIEKTPENTSIAFAEAIAGVYLSEKDNRIISEKMITYFNEFLRTKYFISGNINDPGYPDTLSKKSGVPPETTAALVDAIRQAGGSDKINDQQLLVLNGLIEKFYKNKA